MADATLRIQVTGRQELDSAVQLAQQWGVTITNLNPKMGQLSATFKVAQQNLVAFNSALRQVAPSMDQMAEASKRNFYSLEATAAVFGKFYLVGQVFNTITRSINESREALVQLNYEAARAVPPMNGGDTPNNRQFLQAMMGRGAINGGQYSFNEIGEATYQLSTFIKDQADLASAFDDNMKLLVGTMGSARDVTRLSIQLFQQFGDSMDKTLTPAEKMHRITELLAGAMKDANSEMNEIAAGLKYLGPIASTVNMPLQDVVASIVALSTVGHTGRMAGTETAAILTNLITKYDAKEGGIVQNGRVYKFDRKYKTGADGSQQFDFLGTITDIASRARSLPTQAEQTEYLKAVGGSMNAVRALGAFAPQTIDMLTQSIDNSTKSIQGQRKELESLKDTMEKTFSNRAAEAWKTVLVSIAGTLDNISKSPAFKYLGGIMDMFKGEVQQSLDNTMNANMYSTNVATLQRTQTHRALRTYGLVSGLLQRVNEAGTGEQSSGSVEITGKSIFVNGGTNELSKFIEDSNITSEVSDRDANELMGILRQKGIAIARPGAFGLGTQYEINLEKLRGFQLESQWDYRGMLGRERPGATAGAAPIKKYTGPATVTGSSDDAKRKAEEARRKRMAWLRDQIRNVEAQAAELVHRHGFNSIYEIRKLRPQYIKWVNELADLEDSETLGGKAFRGTTRLDMQLEQLSRQKAGDVFGRSRENYNQLLNEDPFNPALDAMAQQYDADAAALARANFDYAGAASALGSNSRVRALREQRNQMRDAGTAPGGNLLGLPLTINQVRDAQNKARELAYRGSDRAYAQRLLGIETGGLIPGLYVSGDEASLADIRAQQAAKTDRIADLRARKGLLTGGDLESTNAAREIQREIESLTDDLDRLGYSLKRLNSERDMQKFRQGLGDVDLRYQQRQFDLGLQEGRMYGESPDAYQQRRIGLMQLSASSAMQRLKDITEKANTPGLNPELQRELSLKRIQADQDFRAATKQFENAVDDFANSQRDQLMGTVKGLSQGALLDLIHGRGNPAAIVGNVASGIVDQIVLKSFDPMIDMFSGAVADNILALERNTAALVGKDPNSVGGAAGAGSSGKSGVKGKGGLGKDIMYGIGAYGILNTAMQSGNPLSGAFGGIIEGGAMTGWNPIGMAVGGAIGLIGGLFGAGAKKKTPQEVASERSPAFYNTPDDFLYAAYRWRATGGMDDSQYMKDLQAKYRPISETAPVFNVYIDGVKTEVRTEVSRQVSPGSRSNANVFMDYHSPA